MPGDDLERVRRWQSALGESAQAVMEAIGELMEPQIDYYPVRKFPEARPCHGSQELQRFITQFWEAYSVSEWVPQEIVPVGEGRVLTRMTLQAEGRGSGMRLEGDTYHCYWLRHGRFFRIEDHLTVKGALHAFGLDAETLEKADLGAARGSAGG